MRQIEKLYNLLEEKQSAALLKRKLGYIMDLYGECDGSEVRSIVREIVENFSEMILILEKDGKRVLSNGIEWEPEADVDEKEPYPWDPYGLAEIFDPEDENAILGTFETYLSCVAELSEPTVKDYLKRLRRFLREYKEEGTCINLTILYSDIDRIIDEYYTNPDNIERNGKAHGGELAVLKKLKDMKIYIEFDGTAKELIKYIAEHCMVESESEESLFDYSFTAEMPLVNRFLGTQDLEALHRKINRPGKPFVLLLREYIEEFRKTDPKYKDNNPALYRDLGISKNIYSQIMKEGSTYRADKETILLLAFTMKLSVEDAEELLLSAGFSFVLSDERDIAMQFLLEREEYDISYVNKILGEIGLKGFEPRSYYTKKDREDDEKLNRKLQRVIEE